MGKRRRRSAFAGLSLLGIAAGVTALEAVDDPPALAASGRGAVEVGPGSVTKTFQRGPRRLVLQIAPNRPTAQNTISLRITHQGAPVHGGRVSVSFTMKDMEMGVQTFRLAEAQPGVYRYSGYPHLMGGRWSLQFAVAPAGGSRFTFVVLDRIEP